MVVNVVRSFGEDGTLQGILSERGIPFVGCDTASSALCFDKIATKQRLQEAKVPTPTGISIHPGRDMPQLRFPALGPVVVKPAREGSSVGVQWLASPSFVLPALEKHVQEFGAVPVLIEERLPGPEATVSVVQDATGAWQALPVVQVEPAAHGRAGYDFAAKYERDDTIYRWLDGEAAESAQTLALAAVTACGCRDLARVDVMRDVENNLASFGGEYGAWLHRSPPCSPKHCGTRATNLAKSSAILRVELLHGVHDMGTDTDFWLNHDEDDPAELIQLAQQKNVAGNADKPAAKKPTPAKSVVQQSKSRWPRW